MITLKEAFENNKIILYEDILKKKITENSFAVSFHAVLNGTADEIYRNPEKFFKYTHMTNNLQGIFDDVLTRLFKAGTSRPLMVLDTTFGGGKTHTLVALYHLFTSPEKVRRDEFIQNLLHNIDLHELPEISLVAIDCHDLSSVKKKNEARTIWGEIAKQLGNYNIIEAYDKELRRPSATDLSRLIESTGKPVLVLIDELVNYLKDSAAEKIGDQNLAEITMSFLHTLTEVIVNSKNSMLIFTRPGTEPVYSEESELFEKYRKAVGSIASREASFMVPMEKKEIYDVVRKRLFDFLDVNYARRMAENLQEYYAANSENFPEEVVHPPYYEKIINAYPFHPILIDMLYERISTITGFQKTRGVLRLLSHVLKNIYSNLDDLHSDSTIGPGIIDFTDSNIFQELTTKIDKGEFQNIIKTDIVNDESDAKCQNMDSKKHYGSSVRIATSIYLYTLIGTIKELSIGCTQKELVLASSVEGVTYPKDILNDVITLDNTLWYIYSRTGKWYFDVIPNINKIISEETERVDSIKYDPEIKKRLKKMLGITNYFDIFVWEHDIRNPHKPTLVVTNYRDIQGTESEVPDGVKNIIEKEGTSFRTKKNLMYVLAPRKDRIQRMIDAAKRFIAINEIKNTIKSRREIKTHKAKIDELFKESDSNLNASVELCYSLIYYPYRTDVKYITVLDGYKGAKNLPDKIYKALSEKANKILEKIAPIVIVDKILLEKQEININEIWNTFEESPSFPLPKNRKIVYDAVSDGITNKLFGVYTGGIGDLLSISESNYQKVGENFYFGRSPMSGIKDAYYVIPQSRALKIEEKLNSFVSITTDDTKTVTTIKPPVKIPPITQKTFDDMSKCDEYLDWSIKEMYVSFTDIRFFPQLQNKIKIMLLGVSGVTFSFDLKSKYLNLSIKEKVIPDFNKLMDAIHSLSNIFKEELKLKISMKCNEGINIDSDLAQILSGFSDLGEDLEIKIFLEK